MRMSDAPDYTAWAGNGPLAERIRSSGDNSAMVEFAGRVNAEVARLVGGGMSVSDALTAYDPEMLAEGIDVGLE